MKKNILIVLIVAAFSLAACEEEKNELIKEETYTVENVKFDYGNLLELSSAIIETNQESLVILRENIRFIKSKESETTVHAKWIKDSGDFNDHIEAILYVSESDVRKISRAYTNEFEVTMEFEDVEVGKNKE